MSCIVKYKSPSGLVYAYRSESKWDPEKGYSIPTRTYLGRVDESGEIIPTTGKRGRPRKHATVTSSEDERTWSTERDSEFNQLKENVAELTKQIQMLQKQKERSRKLLLQMQQQIGTLLSET